MKQANIYFLILVFLPFLLGYLSSITGSASNIGNKKLLEKVALVLWFSLLIGVIITIDEEGIKSAGTPFTSFLWLTFGLGLGISSKQKFIRTGFSYFGFKYSSAILGTCAVDIFKIGLSFLVLGNCTVNILENLLPHMKSFFYTINVIEFSFPCIKLIQNHPEGVKNQIIYYMFGLGGPILFLSIVSKQLSSSTLKSASKTVISFFTIYGIIELIFNHFYGEFLSSVLWQFPDIDAPVEYKVFFSYAFAVLSSLGPIDPLFEENKHDF